MIPQNAQLREDHPHSDEVPETYCADCGYKLQTKTPSARRKTWLTELKTCARRAQSVLTAPALRSCTRLGAADTADAQMKP
jgi:hypothetical protein